MNQILIIGGLGYIGSRTVLELIQAGHEPSVIDNLCESPLEVKDRIEKIGDKDIYSHRLINSHYCVTASTV